MVYYYIVKCPKCSRYFFMKPIKSKRKLCPGCGEKIKWGAAPKRRVRKYEDARRVVMELNQKRSEKHVSGDSLWDIYRKMK